MRNIFISIALLATLFLAGACVQDEQPALPNGTIRFAIGQASEPGHNPETRATPAELGKPLAERFRLTMWRNGSAHPTYDGRFMESMELPIGSYDITAQCGEDVKIGRDAPYYVGTAQATIEADKSSSVVIPCRVGNALVSVHFGSDAEEKARFARHYAECGVVVKVGTHFLTLTPESETSSIYFPAGSTPELTFYGTPKYDPSRLVSMPLQSEALPSVFQAADHGILTLTLPDPESAIVVEISKAELETVTIEQSIPVSWLPEPNAQATHVYDAQGMLVGTDVACLHPYPAEGSKAVITNTEGTVVRTIPGSGKLTSPHASSQDWPYLNAGEYTLACYTTEGGAEKLMRSCTFTVPQPDITFSFGGYTSYTRYLEGNIDAANACDAHTIYDPSARLNVSEALLAKHPYTFTCTIAGTEETITSGGNTCTFDNKTGMTASLTPHALSASATFDGVTAQSSHGFYITGLPANFTPPTEDAGWSGSGTVSWSSDEVQLSNYAHSGSITNGNFAVPSGTSLEFGYNMMMHMRAFSLTLQVALGSNELFYKADQSGGFLGLGLTERTYNDTQTHTLTSNATEFKCVATAKSLLSTNTGGDCYADVYSLILKYSK